MQEKLSEELHDRYFVHTIGVTAVLFGSVIGSVLVALMLLLQDLRRRRQVQTFRHRSTGWEPLLALPPGCKFSSFLSHVWSTGQDTAHNIVRAACFEFNIHRQICHLLLTVFIYKMYALCRNLKQQFVFHFPVAALECQFPRRLCV